MQKRGKCILRYQGVALGLETYGARNEGIKENDIQLQSDYGHNFFHSLLKWQVVNG